MTPLCAGITSRERFGNIYCVNGQEGKEAVGLDTITLVCHLCKTMENWLMNEVCGYSTEIVEMNWLIPPPTPCVFAWISCFVIVAFVRSGNLSWFILKNHLWRFYIYNWIDMYICMWIYVQLKSLNRQWLSGTVNCTVTGVLMTWVVHFEESLRECFFLKAKITFITESLRTRNSTLL